MYGHLHNFERSWPVYNGSVAAKSYSSPAATVHMVVGMAGDDEGLTHSFTQPAPAWAANRDSRLGYARLRFESAGSMTFEYVLSADGSVADTYTITK